MKIAIISTSATIGGAAIASSRLADALSRQGQEVAMITLDGRSRLPFLAERAEIFARNGLSRTNLFKVSTAAFGLPVASLPEVKEADVVLLGWFNQGLLSLGGLASLGKPIVWTMHDMWAFTGICHHSLGCEGFKAECGRCRFIRRPLRRQSDMSHSVWRKKNRIYRSLPIHFVAVSRWLAEKARSSSLLRGCPVSIIPNPHPISDYTPRRGRENLIVMGAARLDDPIKGIDSAVTALNAVHDHIPDAKVEFFGRIRNARVLSRLRMPYSLAGMLGNEALKDLYGRASVVLSSSGFETSGNTLIEGMACGAVPVSFDRGGQTDIIDHLSTGYLASCGDTDDLARGIRWALKTESDPQLLHDAAESRFGADAVAARYIDLINSL